MSRNLNLARKRKQTPIVDVYLESNPSTIYSIVVPDNKSWSDFLQKIISKFNLPSTSNLSISLQNSSSSSNIEPINIETSNMSKIIHKSIFSVSIQQNIDNNNDNSSSNDEKSLQNNDNNDNIEIYNDDKLFYDNNDIEKSFGIDYDFFQRFAPKIRPKNKIIYHFHPKLNNINIKNIFNKINNNIINMYHESLKYTIIEFNEFNIKTRRLLWDDINNIQEYDIGKKFEYNFNINKFIDLHVWCIILCHGGKFAACIYKGNTMIEHKTFSRYVTRKKQGKRQNNYMTQSGIKGGKSAGGLKRQANENKLLNEIRILFTKWKKYFINIDNNNNNNNININKIYIHAPGTYNELTIFGNNEEQEYLYPILKDKKILDNKLCNERIRNCKDGNYRLYKKDKRIKKIPILTNNVTLQECQKIHFWLTTCWLKIKDIKK